MKRYMSSEINSNFDGRKVAIGGWAQNIRIIGKLAFIKLRDREGLVQITVKKDNPNFEKIKNLSPESVIYVEGSVKKSNVAERGFEIIPEKIDIISLADVPLPIDFSGKVNTSLAKRLDYRWIDLRNPRNMLIFKVMHSFEKGLREYFSKEGLLEIHSSRFMDSPSESRAELFEVKYFKRKAYLSQSPQFYKQMAMCAGFDKVFEIAPMFRADPSKTARHTTEFISIDVEMSWTDYEELMKFHERAIKQSIEHVIEELGDEVKEKMGIEIKSPKMPFPRITMKEAIEKVKGVSIENIDEFYELDPEGEKALGDYIKKRYNSDFVFLTDFPFAVRPFYHMKKEGELTKSYDLIYKGVEISTGSQREHRYNTLLKQVKEKGLNPEGLRHYLSFFKYGAPPHSGFGMGSARFIMQLLELGNVKEATLLPRDMERLTP
ncbi:aspartate--tRNA(Asn) ligase [Candidatus Micrarchaeota archaeon]|nr:MAG: aspartate--tRNA(Asn) ligase [Candidatus Micrarchaeota archaeon]